MRYFPLINKMKPKLKMDGVQDKISFINQNEK